MPRLKIATVNVNGIRAAHRKGMGEWVESTNPDILALQEVRAGDTDVKKIISEIGGLAEDGGLWHLDHDEASAKGRAGVAVLSKLPIHSRSITLGADDFDSAGRWLETEFEIEDKKLTVVSVYVHSGEVDSPKQVEKYKFLDAMTIRLQQLMKKELVLVVGDLNVGHTELDIKNWKGNIKNSGFLPEERAYFDGFMNEQGWVDIGRQAHPEQPGPYSWWSYRGQAFDNDAGWRIDYQLATPSLAKYASEYEVHRAPSYDTRWSDHSPVVASYSL
ncbi:MAG: exodeoxyribonuclease III [Microbacteriaceae bacterium]|nr:exodeoxyribonuclease III [Microbacteriaceae bacterium]MDR9443906.1 exodeoxyribonuclease III [Microbacteriaceae bacterium]